MVKNPWQTLKSREIYINPWIRVREDDVIRPNGAKGTYSVVEARKNATGVVAVDEEGKIILVGQYRYPLEEYSWEIVEGGSEDGETPLETIKRELEEEAGLRAEKWQQLGGEVALSNCCSDEKAYLFSAENLSSVSSHPDDTEVLTIKKVTLAEALKMVETGEIKDAMTIIAILLYSRKVAASRKP